MQRPTLVARRWTRRSLAALMVAVGVIAFVANPAAAAGTVTGTGGGTGTYAYTRTLVPPACARFTAMTYKSNSGYTGTYTAVDDTGKTATYNGPLSVTLAATAVFYANVAGTFLNVGENCVVPGPVPVTSNVDGTGSAGDVTCTKLIGQFERAAAATTTVLRGTCTVKDSVTGVTVTGTVAETRVGVIGACDAAPPTTCQSTDRYVAA